MTIELLYTCIQYIQSNLQGEDTLEQWPLSFVQRLSSSWRLPYITPYNYWGESESRSRVWTQNTLCLPIFGPKPYVDKLEVVNSPPRSQID